MTHRTVTLGDLVVEFFQSHLPTRRGVSRHTLQSYRDALVLWLRFLAEDAQRPIERLGLQELTVERTERFLAYLEATRGNSVRTRNVRLAAIHTFARFLAHARPEQLGLAQHLLAIPFKRGAVEHPVDYLEAPDVDRLLKAIDLASPTGPRDYALILLMFNTGARVQEVLDLRVRDLQLEPPEQVRFLGKGLKVRLCPLWPRTARVLGEWLRAGHEGDPKPDERVFRNRRGGALTRCGVRYLLRKYLPQFRSAGGGRALHPHVLRHTTAVHMLKAGVEFATISQWLGHASLTTTMRYARADLDLKRQALATVFPGTAGAPRGGQLRWHGVELTRWLRRL